MDEATARVLPSGEWAISLEVPRPRRTRSASCCTLPVPMGRSAVGKGSGVAVGSAVAVGVRVASSEGAWVAVGCNAYFGGIYRAAKARGKKANTAITIVASRMATIVYRMLTERREFKPLPPHAKTPAALF